MALLEAVVFPQNHQRLRQCCRSCGTSCVLCGYGVGIGVAAGEAEGVIETGVVVQEGEGLVALVAPPHGSACCAWADVAAGGAVTSWVGPVPTTLTTSPARRPAHQTAARTRRLRLRSGAVAKAARRRRSVVEAESHRLNHIAVERNRRRQMNAYLAALRGLMPPSYARRGDQASIVGGAINFVKELEHHLQSLQAQRRPATAAAAGTGHGSERFPGFFTFPQYSTAAVADNSVDDDPSSSGTSRPTTRPGAVDVEAAVSEDHATVKVFAPRRPGQQQLLRLLLGLQSQGLAAHHLNATTTGDGMVLYTVSLRMEDGCQLSSADDVAAAVHSIAAVAGMDEGRAVI